VGNFTANNWVEVQKNMMFLLLAMQHDLHITTSRCRDPCISIASENVDAPVGVEPCISIASENVDTPITTDEAAPVPAARKRRCDIVDKTNCPAEMVITKRGDVWIVTRLNLEHNHNLLALASSCEVPKREAG